MHNTRWPITPHAARKLRMWADGSLEKYRVARRRALAVKASGANLIAREDAVSEALEARRWYWIDRRRLESRTGELGAAWSPKGLARVQAAAKRRTRP